MSLLTSLVRAYDRLPVRPPFRFSTEKIAMMISVRDDGSASVIDLRGDEKKRPPRMMPVPQAVKRTVAIAPNFLWDKTAYVLGVTAGAGKRTAQEHQDFKDLHAKWLAGTDDPGLLAFLRFLAVWTPDQALPGMADDLRDQNAIFAYESDRLSGLWLHNRPAALAIWRKKAGDDAAGAQMCLVNGEMAPVARLHPSIKGVRGAQSSGAALVSFNLDAFTSYGHEQGDNAPVSEAAAFAYTTALNLFLTKDSGHRIQIGDASTVFWADGSAVEAAASEGLFFGLFGGGDAQIEDATAEDRIATKEIKLRLEMIQQGTALAHVAPKLAKDVRFHILGLAPNAARLSVRFHYEDDFGKLVENYQNHLNNLRLDPPPRDGVTPLWQYLRELAVLRKPENVPPNLAGDWMRAILTGQPYPLSLLATTLMRLRGDGDVNALRVGILKSVLIRNFDRKVKAMLDPEADNKGYVLGRLFAVYEEIQRATLGRNVNATIRDKFYGAASSAPRNVFGTLAALSMNHLTKLSKEKPGLASYFEDRVRDVVAILTPTDNPYPASLPAQDQAMFALGYYHQSSFKSSGLTDTATDKSETEE